MNINALFFIQHLLLGYFFPKIMYHSSTIKSVNFSKLILTTNSWAKKKQYTNSNSTSIFFFEEKYYKSFIKKFPFETVWNWPCIEHRVCREGLTHWWMAGTCASIEPPHNQTETQASASYRPTGTPLLPTTSKT